MAEVLCQRSRLDEMERPTVQTVNKNIFRTMLTHCPRGIMRTFVFVELDETTQALLLAVSVEEIFGKTYSAPTTYVSRESL